MTNRVVEVVLLAMGISILSGCATAAYTKLGGCAVVNVKDYGAKGDGRTIKGNLTAITVESLAPARRRGTSTIAPNNIILRSNQTPPPFFPADVGKEAHVGGAIDGGGTLVATITSVANDGKSAWLKPFDPAAIARSVQDAVVSIGTNDIAAFEAAIKAAGANGTIVIPQSCGYYFIVNHNITPTTQHWSSLDVPSNLRVVGLDDGVTLKMGSGDYSKPGETYFYPTSRPSLPILRFDSAYMLFEVKDSVTLSIEHVTLEGPEESIGNRRWFRGIHLGGDYMGPRRAPKLGPSGSGKLIAKSVITRKMGESVKTDPAIRLGAIEVDLQDCDFSSDGADSEQTTMVGCADNATVKTRRCRFTNRNTALHSETVTYCFYLGITCNLDVDDCDFGQCEGYAIHFEGPPTSTEAPAYCRIANSRFTGDYYSPGAQRNMAAILTNRRVETIIDGCSFRLPRPGLGAVHIGGDVLISSCQFINGDIGTLNSEGGSSDGSNVQIVGCSFRNGAFAPEFTTATRACRYRISNCYFNCGFGAEMVKDGTMAEGSNMLVCARSSVPFTEADVGKYIHVPGAGLDGQRLGISTDTHMARIEKVDGTRPNEAQLSEKALTAVSNVPVVKSFYPYAVSFYYPNGFLSVDHCLIEGASPGVDAFIKSHDGEIEVRDCRLLNAIGTSGAPAIWAKVDPAKKNKIVAEGNYFGFSDSAIRILPYGSAAGVTDVAGIDIKARRALKSDLIPSTPTMLLDFNYDVFRISGSAAIKEINFFSANPGYNAQEITLIGDDTATWSLQSTPAGGSGGNILADAGQRAPGRGVKLVWVHGLGRWSEVK